MPANGHGIAILGGTGLYIGKAAITHTIRIGEFGIIVIMPTLVHTPAILFTKEGLTHVTARTFVLDFIQRKIIAITAHKDIDIAIVRFSLCIELLIADMQIRIFRR